MIRINEPDPFLVDLFLVTLPPTIAGEPGQMAFPGDLAFQAKGEMHLTLLSTRETEALVAALGGPAMREAAENYSQLALKRAGLALFLKEDLSQVGSGGSRHPHTQPGLTPLMER